MKNQKITLPKFLTNRYNHWKSTSYFQNEKNIKKLAKLGQKPQAMIISCCDSRVNVASIFGAKEGDFFIYRNIANIIPPYKSTKTDHSTFAAIEYAVKELKVPNFIVIGHTNCGGIKAGHSQHSKGQNKKYKFINSWLSNLGTAFKNTPKKLSIKNQINFLEEENVRVSIINLLEFPIVKKMVKNNKISIYGLIYNISSGELKSL
tara:strand:+ start:1021 stop:1635 length:615 start_codon:yes stop_codon:yes gene_type:complete